MKIYRATLSLTIALIAPLLSASTYDCELTVIKQGPVLDEAWDRSSRVSFTAQSTAPEELSETPIAHCGGKKLTASLQSGEGNLLLTLNAYPLVDGEQSLRVTSSLPMKGGFMMVDFEKDYSLQLACKSQSVDPAVTQN